MSAPPDTPTSNRRSVRQAARNAISETPSRSQRSSTITPRASRGLAEVNAPQSSPIFFASSSPAPVNGSEQIGLDTTPSGNATRRQQLEQQRLQQQRQRQQDLRPSSPIRAPSTDIDDADVTPRASRQQQPVFDASSPIHYTSSSSPSQRVGNRTSHLLNLNSDSSGLFVGSTQTNRIATSRGPIRADTFGRTHRNRFIDENGMPVTEGDASGDNIRSEATFSNLNPDTSEADALGGNSTRIIWGTNISIQDSMSAFKNFLYNYARKYRMWADGMTEEDTREMGSFAEEKEYITMLDGMRQLGVTTLNLDIRNLKAYPATLKLWHQIQAYPQEIIPIMDQTTKDVMLELALREQDTLRAQASQRRQTRFRDSSSVTPGMGFNSDVDNETAAQDTQIPNVYAEIEGKMYKVMPFGLDKSVNMRDLDPADMDKLICIKGLVIRTTPIIPDMKEAFFRCEACGYSLRVDIDRGKIAEPTKCPRRLCETKNSMQLIHNRSTFADKQVVKLQETPDSVPDGQTPHSVSLCTYDELVDVCKAGDRIQVTGIFRCNPVKVNARQRVTKSLFKTYVDVLHIQKVDKKKLGVDASTVEQELAEKVANEVEQVRKISEEEEKKIKEISQRPDLYDLLSRSLAPSIYELDDVKKGVLLQLFGGTNKVFEKGGNPRYRGDINILLCGDPSTSKSQLLQYIHKIAPRGVYTSGKGSSAVGLTAYVTRDPETRQLVLESGALVLSDGGICCIDEFDKMNDSTRSVLHEVMEQQTVSIAKAGIITTLNARTSILASANPINSKYNPNLPVPQNIDLPPTLLSRFDLVYLVLDRIDESIDRKLAKHLVNMYLEDTPESASREEILPVEFLTSYVTYAKANIHPRLTPEAGRALSDAYVAMRKLGDDIRAADRRITATTRQLESMIRLSEAHARMRLSKEVTATDVEEAVRLIRSALKQAATDVRTGLIDMSLLTEGTSASERRLREDLVKGVLSAVEELGGRGRPSGVRWSDVWRLMSESANLTIEANDFSTAVRSLELQGQVTVVGEGARRSIRRVGIA
ncbi:hypothetical protein KEM54_000488 [Ascosphaera aggregata]|nr:hypothetical protein KEM54_000488 [Ascosphaera aggregata]